MTEDAPSFFIGVVNYRVDQSVKRVKTTSTSRKSIYVKNSAMYFQKPAKSENFEIALFDIVDTMT